MTFYEEVIREALVLAQAHHQARVALNPYGPWAEDSRDRAPVAAMLIRELDAGHLTITLEDR